MAIVLKFLHTNTNLFEAFVKQEQQLHSNSIYQYLLDKRTPVNTDIKNTVRELVLFMDNEIVNRLRLLPGVKTLFRDSEEAYPWCL